MNARFIKKFEICFSRTTHHSLMINYNKKHFKISDCVSISKIVISVHGVLYHTQISNDLQWIKPLELQAEKRKIISVNYQGNAIKTYRSLQWIGVSWARWEQKLLYQLRPRKLETPIQRKEKLLQRNASSYWAVTEDPLVGNKFACVGVIEKHGVSLLKRSRNRVKGNDK